VIDSKVTQLGVIMKQLDKILAAETQKEFQALIKEAQKSRTKSFILQ